MKKTLIFLGIFFTIALSVSLNQVLASETSIETLTTDTEVSTSTVYSNENYVYSDYQDLLNQLYEDIYPEVHDQIYDQIMNDLDNDYYDEIYASVENQLADLLDEDQLEVYLSEFQNQIYEVLDIAENSVFGVSNYISEDEGSIGSGVVYKYDSQADLYYLITNYHVIEDSLSLEIRFEDESLVPATILGYDTEVDIAILTFSGEGLSNITVSELGDSNSCIPSDFVLAMGNPEGYDFYRSATLGIISGMNREVDSNGYVQYIQHDAAINGGNSGGPIYNLDGEVIGINVLKLSDDSIEGLGFSIPINTVKEIIGKIEDDGLLYNTIMPRISTSFYVVEDLRDGTQITFSSLSYNGDLLTDYTIDLPSGVTEGLIAKTVSSDGTLGGLLTTLDLIYQIDDFTVTDLESFQEYIYSNYHAEDTCTIYYYEFNSVTESYSSTPTSIEIQFK